MHTLRPLRPASPSRHQGAIHTLWITVNPPPPPPIHWQKSYIVLWTKLGSDSSPCKNISTTTSIYSTPIHDATSKQYYITMNGYLQALEVSCKTPSRPPESEQVLQKVVRDTCVPAYIQIMYKIRVQHTCNSKEDRIIRCTHVHVRTCTMAILVLRLGGHYHLISFTTFI